jgi:hypothetical protein
MYSILQTAKLNGIDPEAYATDIFSQIAAVTRSTASPNGCFGPFSFRCATLLPDLGQNRTLTHRRKADAISSGRRGCASAARGRKPNQLDPNRAVAEDLAT